MKNRQSASILKSDWPGEIGVRKVMVAGQTVGYQIAYTRRNGRKAMLSGVTFDTHAEAETVIEILEKNRRDHEVTTELVSRSKFFRR